MARPWRVVISGVPGRRCAMSRFTVITFLILPVASFAASGLAGAVRPASAVVSVPPLVPRVVKPALVTHTVASARAVRHPFWPIGYEGERAVISAENRVPAPARSADVPDEPDST